jgi:hypothetical protein
MIARVRSDERGFVLSIVIFAVAALSIAGTALFLVVQSEGAMADSGADSSNAFHLANAGLGRYMGESFGLPDDSVDYEMGDGTVTVTAKRVATLSPTEDVYLITAEAEIADRRHPALVSRRRVHQFATLRRQPFQVVAAVVVASADVSARNVTLDGNDQAGSSECATGGTTVAGLGALGAVDASSSSISGSPDVLTHSYAAMMNAMDLDWGTVVDPATPFDFEVPDESWPGFGLLAPDEYPTIRVDGNLRARSWQSGRGLLVVTGELDFDNDFEWEGVILAGSLARNANGRVVIEGALMTGFAGQAARADLKNANIRFNSCNVLSAAEGIAMFSPMSNTWWESGD